VARFAAKKTAQWIHYSLHQYLPLNEDNTDCALVEDSHNTSKENREKFQESILQTSDIWWKSGPHKKKNQTFNRRKSLTHPLVLYEHNMKALLRM